MKKFFLLLLLTLGLTSVSYADYLDDWPDEALCGWMDNPSPPSYMVEEVNKRGISCSWGVVINNLPDLDSDLAVLSVKESSKALQIKPGCSVRRGQEILTIGHPEGYNYSMTKGIVSNIRTKRLKAGGNFKNFANGLKREYSILDHFFNCGTYPVPIKLNFNNGRSLSRFLIPEAIAASHNRIDCKTFTLIHSCQVPGCGLTPKDARWTRASHCFNNLLCSLSILPEALFVSSSYLITSFKCGVETSNAV